MEFTCHQCGYKDDHEEFKYLCRNGCVACGESDLRECPKCGAQVMFSRALALETEDVRMRELCQELSEIPKSEDPAVQQKAMEIIGSLRRMNERWNIPQLNDFIKQRSRELFF
ncbi:MULTISPECIES: hypothetical protein [Desulfatibacillum]|uniref:Uncharacterized protein n=1 Tax=Desulfatibacillum alkenivorans DSM 16219 TaxID=1121393 RepID=A0A1M6MA55_9BACT|nr:MULTISPECIES: hypothetical protein [Desulfatibacillum]SHJ80309.1 hypothetical protein SAMN02745216_02292 [Desulfatibacillum alkenivorans DSM 16219]